MAHADDIFLQYDAWCIVQDWGPPNDVAIVGGPVGAWQLLKVTVEVREFVVNGGRAMVDEGWVEADFFWVRAWSQIRVVYDEVFGWFGHKYTRFRVETYSWNAVQGWSMVEEV